MTQNAFPAIEDHGVIGDLRSVALIALDGTIDYFCYPNIDSSSVFAALLDPDKGGHFKLKPVTDDVLTNQLYLPDTNILITRFANDEGVVELIDFMPADGSGRLVRRVCGIRGRLTLSLDCRPRFDYGRAKPQLTSAAGGGVFEHDGCSLRLTTDGDIEVAADDGAIVCHSFELAAGDHLSIVLDNPEQPRLDRAGCDRLFDDAVHFWRRWVEQSSYRGRWRETVHRSALALKLLTSREHGSIAAAATFGLPETIGGERNWDYRYCWLRDSAFTVYALMRIGFTTEAAEFINWLSARAANCHRDGSWQIMYAMDGRAELDECRLDHLRGYRDSRPVRIGNAAYDQLQLDIYGELMDAVYIVGKRNGTVYQDTWRHLTRSIDWVCEHWRQPDEGMWEMRGGRRCFLSSRLLCWVAVDRAIRLANKQSLPAPFDRWETTRNELHASILDDFWDDELQCYVQYQGGKTLDAAALLMPLLKFINPTDPRWLSTLERIEERLVSDCLVHRYDNDQQDVDGLDGQEGAFTTCSFWYVENLARVGRVDKARLVFEKMLSYANHLGLYAEELSPAGRHLGNFPQALTHLSLISAASYLDRALGGQPKHSQ